MIKLIDVLNSPDLVINYSQEQWQVLLAQANSSNLIGRLNYFLKIKNIQVPDYVSWHLKSAEIIADRQKQQALREVYELNKVLGNTHCNLTFLKGSAYIVRNLPCSNGPNFCGYRCISHQRLFSSSRVSLEDAALVERRKLMIMMNNITVNGCMRYLHYSMLSAVLY